MKQFSTSLAALLLVAGTPSVAQQTTRPEQITTPAGTVVRTLPGWRMTTEGPMVRFDAPEGDLRIAVIDVGTAPDAQRAAEAAWARFRPGDAPKLTSTTKRTARQGWDERVGLSYEASSDAPVEVYGSALRHHGSWTVILVDGTRATTDKRDADIGLVFGAHPADYIKESFAGRQAHLLDAARIAAMRSFVETSIRELGIPGAAFGLIDHGKVVFAGGVGVRRFGGTEPVDAHTRFLVASNTKGMTTLLLARLVDQGKLAWSERVVAAYPAFRVGDPALSSSITFGDLVCACTGLPRQDLEWEFNTPPGTPAEVTFSQLAAVRPTSKPGEVFQYNNQLPSAAGYIAGHLLYPTMEFGTAYDRAMRDLIFRPLQMTDTTFSFPQALRGNVASPHSTDVDGHTRVSNILFDQVIIPFRPAGGAWSSVDDMLKYVRLELDKGALPSGERLVSERNLLSRRTRRTPTGEDEWYGMGLWENTASGGVSVIHHGGNMPGYFSDFDVIPDAEVGAVILTNASDGNLLVGPFRRRLLELLYDGKPEAADAVAASAANLHTDVERDRARLILPAEPAVVAKLARRYVNPDLGPMEVRTDASGTRIIANSMVSVVASRRNDDGTVALVPVDPGADSISLVVGTEVDRPTLTIHNGQHAYVFKPA